MQDKLTTGTKEMKKPKKNPPVVISDEHNEIKIYTTVGRSGPLYQISYYRLGERQRKTFADLNEAKRESRMILGRLAGERVQSRNLSALEMESFAAAARTIEATGLPLHVCAELFAEAHRIMGGHSITEAAKYYMKHYDPKRPRKPLNELSEEFQASRRALGVCERYRSSVKSTLKFFMDGFKGKSLDDLTAVELDEWMGRRNLCNLSRNGYRNTLIAFGNFLKKRNYLPASKPSVFEGMMEWKNEVKPVTIFSSEEMKNLLDAASVHILPYFAIGAFAGLRTAEICRLDWKHVHFKRGFIECEAAMTKTRQRRLVPISENLRAWLEPIAPKSGEVLAYSKFAGTLFRFLRRRKIDWKRNALRHSYISNRLALVPDTARVALECGNSPNVIFQHYRELVTPEEAQAWFNIFPGAGYPQCLLSRSKRKYTLPDLASQPREEPAQPTNPTPETQVPNIILLPAANTVAPEIVGDTGLNDEEIRRALLG